MITIHVSKQYQERRQRQQRHFAFCMYYFVIIVVPVAVALHCYQLQLYCYHNTAVHAFSIHHDSRLLLKYSFVEKKNYAIYTRMQNRKIVSSLYGINNDDDDHDNDDDHEFLSPPMDLPGIEDITSTATSQDIYQMTISQLKQQLRLRNMKVSGRKSELIDRLLMRSNNKSNQNYDDDNDDDDVTASKSLNGNDDNERTKDFVDVTEYLDLKDRGKAVKTKSISSSLVDDDDDDDDNISSNKSRSNDDSDDDNSSTSSTEVWGADARLSTSVDDDEYDQRIVIDSISRTVLEYKGSNQTYVEAMIIATRDALKPYMRGGSNYQNNYNNKTTSSSSYHPITTAQITEQRLREIQIQREKETASPIHIDDTDGIDEGDETGIFENILQREVSDWGKYTVTGAQLSAQEVQGVILLSDVYGMNAPDTIALAEKIAFECQPVIVMIPDLFRGNPWTDSNDQSSYEEWRASHSDLRVSVDIRAAAACLRETYGVSSIVVWGTCYGGGKALEAASGYIESIHDVDGITIGPPPVEPMVAIAWYPTRYDVRKLFGMNHHGQDASVISGLKRKVAIMGVFAENDNLPGATPNDAALLKQLLEEDDRIVDHMVKVFPDQSHGFAHIGLSRPHKLNDDVNQLLDEEFVGAGRIEITDGDADVAALLSTAFMETYSRVFLPTTGPPISTDDSEWGRELTMFDLKDKRNRNIRDEIKVMNDNFIEEPLMSGPLIDPTDPSNEDELAKLLRSMQPKDYEGKYKIQDDDDLPTIYKKLLSADENFQIF